MRFECPGDDARGALREQVLSASWTTLGPWDGTGREDRREVQIVGDEDGTVLMCPRRDLVIGRGRGADGGPVDSVEPVTRQPVSPLNSEPLATR